MTPAEIFADKDAAELSEALCLDLADVVAGESPALAITALFVSLVAVCKADGRDAVHELETLTAMLNGRAAPTHAAPGAVQ